ncbi:hypothetical protein MCHI_001517, partial [Candidatus Magnetoovum chiemensis]
MFFKKSLRELEAFPVYPDFQDKKASERDKFMEIIALIDENRTVWEIFKCHA